MKRNTRDTRGQCTRRRKVINLKGIKPASHRTPGVRDKLAARPPSSPVYSNDSNARGLRSLWRPRRRNLDPRNTMDPRWQPLLPICPRFRPCSSVRGSFPNPIISVRRAGGGEKEDYLDSRDFLDNRRNWDFLSFSFSMPGIGSNPLMGFLFGESDMEKCEIYNKNKINPIRSTYFCEISNFNVANTF